MTVAISVNAVSKRFILKHNASMSIKQKISSITNKTYRSHLEEFWALKDINFTINHGESIAFLGHNGCGKSTLMKLISGVYKPTLGKVTINGRLAPLIELGAGFHPELTGQENIYLNGCLLGMSNQEITEKYQEITDFAELGDFIDTPVKNYSSGMAMRLGFAIAVYSSPSILIADEVLAVGDAYFQEKCHRKIRDMQNHGLTLILVTHVPEHAELFCQRYIKLDHGKVIETGFF
ncbi:ABC transporter ATP-binding protein [Agitococcus lubricus]|uniref:ABC-2 type transport system ATP-binding protein/lipopolysaccharide transport system ATP-binding protein n=1 Tax=Agitococcus lubricus TaxID=1077255 RepID=A0A2T5J132_9GAMM|nr:ABC transporter ATP-binding protein [Agitococcus lubricus]PTQ90044.1 ABC-2 type transport system ATP-binding protein/lipopolysaccharide transport system ATP-binding protein [Agitococcus lubricus]